MRLMCLVTAGSMAMLTGCTGTPSVPSATTRTQSASAKAEAKVSFPGASGVEATATTRPVASDMQAAVPAQASLDQVVDLDMKSGEFPASGAELTFTLDQPLPIEKMAITAAWDAGNKTWLPLASETSPDGTSVRAKLAHFSTYGLLDVTRNAIGGLIGVRASPPECKSAPPSWDDKSAPQFFDDLNGPVLWCATSDPDHPDDLEIKLKLNRGAAASITTAVTPAWVHSDLWDTLKPETWATMVLSGPEPLIPNPETYFIQPTGEFDFRFAKTDLLKFWHSNRTQPLIEVDTSPSDVLAGLLFTVVSDSAPGSSVLPLVTSAMAVTQCTSDIYDSVGDLTLSSATVQSVAPKIGAALGTVGSCLSGQSEFVAQAAARYLATRNPALSLEDLVAKTHLEVKGIIFWARIFAAIQVLTPVADALTDLLLDPIARQFNFQPSDEALKAFLGPSKTELGSVVAPAMCNRPAGQLVNGELPIPKVSGGPDPGFTILYGNKDGGFMHAIGDTSTGTQGLTALVFGCSIGGVGWPATVAIYDPHLQLLASFNLSDIDHKEHSDVDAIRFEDQALRIDWRTNPEGGAGACVTVHKTGRLSTKPIPGVVPSLSLTPEDVRVVSQDPCSVAGH